MNTRYYHGYKVSMGGEIIATFDDDVTPHLTPGGQRRAAWRIARKAIAKGHTAEVFGYFGSLGAYVQIDDGEDCSFIAARDDANYDWVSELAALDD